MFGQNKIICVAGKNQCSIDFLRFISSIIIKKNILVLPNKSDKGADTWQPSLKKYAKKHKYKIVSINELYKMFNKKYGVNSVNIPDQKGNYRETLRVNDDLINLLNWQPKDRLREYIKNL